MTIANPSFVAGCIKLPNDIPLFKGDVGVYLHIRNMKDGIVTTEEFVTIPLGYAGFVYPIREGETVSSPILSYGFKDRLKVAYTFPQGDMRFVDATCFAELILMKVESEPPTPEGYVKDVVEAFTDGGKTPRGAICSYTIRGDNSGVHVYDLGSSFTSNQAEYMGVIKALLNINATRVSILSDAKLIVNQINTAKGTARKGDKFQCRDEKLKPLLAKVISLCKGRNVTFTWIRRGKNEAHTDELPSDNGEHGT